MEDVVREFPRLNDEEALSVAAKRLHGPRTRRMDDEIAYQESNYITPECEMCGGSGVKEFIGLRGYPFLGFVVASHPTNSLVVGDRVVVSPNDETGKRWDWNFVNGARIPDHTARVLIGNEALEQDHEWIPGRTVMVYMPEDLLRVRL